MPACSRGRTRAASRGRSSAPPNGAGAGKRTRSARPCRCSRSTSIARGRRCPRLNAGACRRRRTSCGGCSNAPRLAAAEPRHHLPRRVVDAAPGARDGRQAPGRGARSARSRRPRAASRRHHGRAIRGPGRELTHEMPGVLAHYGGRPPHGLCCSGDIGDTTRVGGRLRVPCADVVLDVGPPLRRTTTAAPRLGSAHSPATADVRGER
jgi:hypothetical protein